jgi:hypothetical protein
MARAALSALALAMVLFSALFAPGAGGAAPEKAIGAPTSRSWHVPDPNAFLRTRTRTGAMLGSFDSYASLLFATSDVAIHTNEPALAKKQLWAPFPEKYKPTWGELFEAIGRSTGSSFLFDANTDYWVFAKPAMPLPYSITLAKGWKAEDRGEYVAHIPSIAPVGMDVYVCGRYSGDEDEPNLFLSVRDELAGTFAEPFEPNTPAKAMKRVQVDGAEALYYEGAHPKNPSVAWRQWVFVKDGRGIAIVSAIKKENEAKLLPDVQAMVASFKLVKNGAGAGSKPAASRPG